MKPYYEEAGIEIYHGDARELLPLLGCFASVVTDPVWPNSIAELPGSDRPAALFSEAAQHFPQAAERVVVHLGCDSDPRFLSGMPVSMPFLRACHLEYVRPHYKGRLLYTHDVAYVFGQWPKSKRGARVLPGRVIKNDATKRFLEHPCPRQEQHVRWLVHWFGGESIVDPFMGSGTTLIATAKLGLRGVGIEISERFCEAAANRLASLPPILSLGMGT